MANPRVRFDILANSRTAAAFAKTRREMDGMRRATGRVSDSAKRNRRLIQQAGMQISDFSVQVAGGQSAILAFTQQFPQFIQGFGAVGGVAAGLITVLGSLALVLTNTGKGLSEIEPLMGFLREEFKLLTNVVVQARELFFDLANVLVNNLDLALGTIVALAGFMAGRWVASFVVARGVVGALTASMVGLRAVARTVLRGTIVGGIAFVISALIKVRQELGSWGAAWEVVGDLVRDFFDRLKKSAMLAGDYIASLWRSMANSFNSALAGMARTWANFVQLIADGVAAVPGISKIAEGVQRAADRAKAGLDEMEAGIQRISDLEKSVRQNIKQSFVKVWTEAGPAWTRLAKLIKSTTDVDVRTFFEDVEVGAENGGGAVNKLNDKLTEAQKRMQSLADSMKSSFSEGIHSMVDGTKSFSDAVKGMARAVIKQLYDIIVVQRIVGTFDVKTGKGRGLVGGIMKFFTGSGFFGRLNSFDGGGHTGRGARTGGVDGRGGFPAILHPNETVIDHTKIGSSRGSVLVEVVGGDLTLSDDGTIMAQVRIQQAQTASFVRRSERESFSPRIAQQQERGTV